MDKHAEKSFDNIRETVSEDVTHLYEVLKEFSSVMVGTMDTSVTPPVVRARPMAIVKLERNGTMYFITDVGSTKIEEVAIARQAHIFAQAKNLYVSLTGATEISQDRVLLRDLWTKINDAWFNGPEDPRACVLIVRPDQAELWDIAGAKGVKYLVRTAAALLSGKPMSRDEDSKTHETIKLAH